MRRNGFSLVELTVILFFVFIILLFATGLYILATERGVAGTPELAAREPAPSSEQIDALVEGETVKLTGAQLAEIFAHSRYYLTEVWEKNQSPKELHETGERLLDATFEVTLKGNRITHETRPRNN